MARDVYTEVTKTGLGSRLSSSFGGILVGALLFLVAFPVLFWNEGRAVKEYKSLTEGEGLVQSISASEIRPEHEGKLVHFSGLAESDQRLSDDLFGIQADGLRLQRRVEMYQWDEDSRTETKTNTGGSQTKTTTYSYERRWSASVINSSGFKKPEGHQNPNSMPFDSESFAVSDARIGQVQLPQDLLGRIGGGQTIAPSESRIPPTDRRGRVSGQYIYYGNSDSRPEVGDLRVSFEVVPESTVSVVAQLVGRNLRPYQTSVGGEIYMLQSGAKPASAMFEQAHTSNKILTWVLRVVGFFMMFIGIAALAGPLRVLADIIPFVGRLVGAGIGLVAGGLAFVFSGVTISIAWFVYRPLLAISVLALVAAAIYWLNRKGAAAQAAGQSPAPVGAPPPPPPA